MNVMKLYPLMVLVALLASCAGGKYASTEKIYKSKAKTFSAIYKDVPAKGQLEKVRSTDKEWIASTNFGLRKPNYVVIHHTAQKSLDQTIKTFHNEKVGVSSHYVIGRDGKVVQMVNDYFRAHHAGLGKWGNDSDLNSSSIGIELDNDGLTDPWTEVQINALLNLLATLKENYKIPQANFIGHMDLAPTRKNDPSRFPWDRLAENGYGFWYDGNLEMPPVGFDVKLALRIIGYDVKDLAAAIKAFKLHYVQGDSKTADMNDQEMKILYAIFKKFL